MTIQEKLNTFMKDNGYKSLKQLALDCKIPYTTLKDLYKKNNPDNSKLSTARTLAKFMKCKLDYLAYDEITDPNMTAPELFESLEHSNVIPDDNKFSIEIKSNVPFEELDKEEQQEYIDEAMERLLLMKKANKQTKNE